MEVKGKKWKNGKIRSIKLQEDKTSFSGVNFFDGTGICVGQALESCPQAFLL
jgi:hypothetical protein